MLKGVLWYSKRQERAARDVAWSGPAALQPPTYNTPLGRLADGREVVYTEILPDGEESLYDDAVRLGEGEYIGG